MTTYWYPTPFVAGSETSVQDSDLLITYVCSGFLAPQWLGPHVLQGLPVIATLTSLADFFQSDSDPLVDHLDPATLTSPIDADDSNLSEDAVDYLDNLDLATHVTQESTIDEFALAILKLLDFDEPHVTIHTRYVIPLTVCGVNSVTQIDVCFIYRSTARGDWTTRPTVLMGNRFFKSESLAFKAGVLKCIFPGVEKEITVLCGRRALRATEATSSTVAGSLLSEAVKAPPNNDNDKNNWWFLM